ncbi:hypothetical protein MNV49_006788 [Pseudohyphozyma bogoriensis]|nr:hypothetical protein MNV49_006788 [Pseudohyphozyma bogoriensis]
MDRLEDSTDLVLQTTPYTPFYCEENVYKLIESLPPTSCAFALFITNADRLCLLFHQRASTRGPGQGNYVIWDYHAVVAVVEDGKVDVLDRDSLLGTRVPLQDYLAFTFGSSIPSEFASRVRIVPAKDFLENFASDRSHMLRSEIADPSNPSAAQSETDSTSPYLQPPPPYPPICGIGAKSRGLPNNLFSHFLDVGETWAGEEGFGRVLGAPQELLSLQW